VRGAEAVRRATVVLMCVNCVSNGEAVAASLALVAAVLKNPVHDTLARAGLVAERDPVARDAHTVAFLRDLALDPVEILGAEVVAAADAWAPRAQPPPLRTRLGSMRSQRAIALP
jgi:hypothetical protein